MYTDLKTLCVQLTSSLQEAITLLDRNRLGIVLVVDDEHRLLGTITDGDMRRAMLSRVNLEQPVSALLVRKTGTGYATPITAAVETDPQGCLRLLQQHRVRHLPLLDHAQHVVGLMTLDDFIPDQGLALQAVVMPGGIGSRLHPLTANTPKPMLELGGRPLLEIIIQQLREAGIRQVKVTTHHKPEKIAQYFGDGKHFGVELSCVSEERPLGTAGSLGLFEVPKETTLVMNGDILTLVDFRAMLVYHREHQADLTVAVRPYEVQVPYGVIECDGAAVRRLSEKPQMECLVNAGIYLLEPLVYQFLPNGQPFDMTDLIQRLLDAGRSVISFPVREYWLDIGGSAEYERANEDVRTGKVRV